MLGARGDYLALAASCRSRPHSITLSAIISSDCGMVRPNALAVPPYVNAQIAGSAALASRSTNPSIEIVYSLAWAR